MVDIDVDARLDDNRLNRSLTRIARGWRNIREEIRDHNRAVGGAQGRIDRLSRSVGRLSAAAGTRAFGLLRDRLLLTTAAVTGLSAAFIFGAKSLADYARELDETASTLGVSASRFFQYRRLFSEFAIDSTKLFDGLTTASQRALEEGNAGFRGLGIAGQDFLALDLEGRINLLSRELSKIPDLARATGLAMRILGEDAGRYLINPFRELNGQVPQAADNFRTFQTQSIASVRDIGNNIQFIFDDIRAVSIDLLAALSPSFIAFRSLWDNTIFPYLETSVIPRLNQFIQNDVNPFFESFFGQRSVADTVAQINDLNMALTGLTGADNQERLSRLVQLYLEFEGIEAGEDARNNAVSFFNGFADAVDLATQAIDPFIQAYNKLDPIVGDVDFSDLIGDVTALIGSLPKLQFGRGPILSAFINTIAAFGEGDVARLGVSIGQLFSRSLAGLVNYIPTQTARNAVSDLLVRILAGIEVINIGAVGNRIGAALSEALDNFLPDTIRNSINKAFTRLADGFSLSTLSRTALTRVAGVLTGGLIDAVVAAIRGGDSGDIVWQGLLGSIASASFLLGPQIGLPTTIATVIVDALFGEFVSARFKDFFDMLQREVELAFNEDVWYNIGATIGNAILDGFDASIDLFNAAVRRFEGAGILGVDLNPINYPEVPNIGRIPLRTIRQNTGFTDFASGGNVAGNAVGGSFSGQPPNITIENHINIDGTALDESTFRSFIRLIQNGEIEGATQ